MDYGTDYYAVHADGVVETMNSLGTVCPQLTWNTQTYRCLPSGRMRQGILGQGGFSLNADLSVTLLAADFGGGPYPESNQDIFYPASSQFRFRIESVTWMPGGDLIRIKATAAAKL